MVRARGYPVGLRSIASSGSVCRVVYVCLSVRSRVSKTTHPNFVKFSLHSTCDRDSVSVLLWRQTDIDVMYFRFSVWRHFSHNKADGQNHRPSRHVCRPHIFTLKVTVQCPYTDRQTNTHTAPKCHTCTTKVIGKYEIKLKTNLRWCLAMTESSELEQWK